MNAARVGGAPAGSSDNTKKRKSVEESNTESRRRDHYIHIRTSDSGSQHRSAEDILDRMIKLKTNQLELAKSVAPDRVPNLQKELMHLYDRLTAETEKELKKAGGTPDAQDSTVAAQDAVIHNAASFETVLRHDSRQLAPPAPYCTKRSVPVSGGGGGRVVAAASAATVGEYLSSSSSSRSSAEVLGAPTQELHETEGIMYDGSVGSGSGIDESEDGEEEERYE